MRKAYQSLHGDYRGNIDRTERQLIQNRNNDAKNNFSKIPLLECRILRFCLGWILTVKCVKSGFLCEMTSKGYKFAGQKYN